MSNTDFYYSNPDVDEAQQLLDEMWERYMWAHQEFKMTELHTIIDAITAGDTPVASVTEVADCLRMGMEAIELERTLLVQKLVTHVDPQSPLYQEFNLGDFVGNKGNVGDSGHSESLPFPELGSMRERDYPDKKVIQTSKKEIKIVDRASDKSFIDRFREIFSKI